MISGKMVNVHENFVIFAEVDAKNRLKEQTQHIHGSSGSSAQKATRGEKDIEKRE